MLGLLDRLLGIFPGFTKHITPNDGPILESIGLCMVRNEQDIIEPFLRHNAPLLDLLIVLDNLSIDNTRSIAAATARDLGNVVIIDLPDRAYNQSSTMSRMLRLAQSACFARYVFFLHADEFLSANSRQALSEHLARIPSGGSGLMPWKTFVPDPNILESAAPDPLDRLTRCRKAEEPQYHKSVLRLDGAFDPRLTVGQGNHVILDARGRELPSLVLEDLPLLHLPLRSADQLLVKGYLGWLANQARPKRNRRRRQGLQWKHLYDIAKAGETLDADRLTQEAVDYIQYRKGLSFQEATISLPHNVKVSRRHSDGRFMDASSLIAASTTETDSGSFQLPAPANAGAVSTTVENAFDAAWHWDHLFLDEPFIRAAIDLLNPKSILDLGCGRTLLHKSGDGRTAPFPGQTYPTTFVTGIPSAV